MADTSTSTDALLRPHEVLLVVDSRTGRIDEVLRAGGIRMRLHVVGRHRRLRGVLRMSGVVKPIDEARRHAAVRFAAGAAMTPGGERLGP